MLKPNFCKTFEDYDKNVFLPNIDNQLKTCSRVDVVWDEYREDSLKASTRGERGKEIRKRDQEDSAIPGNWESFLRIYDNKTGLFTYLAEQLTSKDTSQISPCNHEEADKRIMLHVKDAVQTGMRQIMIRTLDNDVVVIAISIVHKLNILNLWTAFGVGKKSKIHTSS
ncbi:hypothetical protein DPMN_018065 [Dreissena polymorpha]|uniref:Uncharacterized protein n=1 Tax=Dreissena polymorpha TaxID=45954 RepID=A0A9D4NCK1_DREPO|nr:hypothetical protein DPMN_018065 [Dreissena polymorpha]